MTTYRIRDWGKHFENNRTRELKELRFVVMPNKQDGDGYTELVDHPNGAAHLGAWCSIIQVASKCDPRGTLLRDGARPHDSTSLARLTRLPQSVFEEVLPRLVQIGWIEESEPQTKRGEADSETPQDVGTEPQEAAGKRAAYRIGSDRIEENGIGKKEKQEEVRADKPRLPGKVTKCDEDFLNELQADEAYKRLDVRLLHAKMVRWCKEKRKVPTRARLINWLNKEDQPMEGDDGTTQQRNGYETAAEKRDRAFTGQREFIVELHRKGRGDTDENASGRPDSITR